MGIIDADRHLEVYQCQGCCHQFRYTKFAAPETKRADFADHAKVCPGTGNNTQAA